MSAAEVLEEVLPAGERPLRGEAGDSGGEGRTRSAGEAMAALTGPPEGVASGAMVARQAEEVETSSKVQALEEEKRPQVCAVLIG